MRPFSPLCYIKENIRRSLALILLFSTVMVCYLGGVYVKDPIDDFHRSVADHKNMIQISESEGEDANTEYAQFKEQADNIEHISYVIPANSDVVITYDTVMGYGCYSNEISFLSEEDFKNYNQIVDIMPQDFELQDKEMIISDMLAKNLGISVGEVITTENKKIINLAHDTRVAATFPGDCYRIYIIDSNSTETDTILLKEADDLKGDRLVSSVKSIKGQYPKLTFLDYQLSIHNIDTDMDSMLGIFFGIVIMVSFVLAITINATFQGAFEKRKFEFSIYKAIGFSKAEITRKIVGEIFYMNLFGILGGGIILFLLLYLINNLMLIPAGLQMEYYCGEALFAVIFCNLIIVFPMLFSQLRRLKKFNATEF